MACEAKTKKVVQLSAHPNTIVIGSVDGSEIVIDAERKDGHIRLAIELPPGCYIKKRLDATGECR